MLSEAVLIEALAINAITTTHWTLSFSETLLGEGLRPRRDTTVGLRDSRPAVAFRFTLGHRPSASETLLIFSNRW
jgi:hypothetical protein